MEVAGISMTPLSWQRNTVMMLTRLLFAVVILVAGSKPSAAQVRLGLVQISLGQPREAVLRRIGEHYELSNQEERAMTSG